MHSVGLGGLAVVLALAPAAPARASGAEQQPDRLVVATTVAPITSIVANIAGERAEVVGIVPEGTNSHTFEPLPSDAELLSRTDVLYANGLQLEEPIVDLAAANLADPAAILRLGNAVLSEEDLLYDFSFPESEGKPNPHLWTDPHYARLYAEVVANDLAARDPVNADFYIANFDAFSQLVEELDAAMRLSFATIPRRVLVTYHDAYAYFAETYGWTVLGAIEVSDFSEPSPRDVAELIDQIRAEDVPAIFGSEVFPSPVLEQIAAETGATYVADLRDDDLPGEPGDPEHSWHGLMLFNYITMTDALGGDASRLREIEPRNVVPDTAEYPQ